MLSSQAPTHVGAEAKTDQHQYHDFLENSSHFSSSETLRIYKQTSFETIVSNVVIDNSFFYE
jgi:hypothetical protein